MRVILHLEHEQLQTEENFYYPNSYCDFQQFELVFVPNNVGKLIIYKLIAHLECLLKVWYTAYPLIVLEKWKVCGFFQCPSDHKACINRNLWHPHQKKNNKWKFHITFTADFFLSQRCGTEIKVFPQNHFWILWTVHLTKFSNVITSISLSSDILWIICSLLGFRHILVT